MEGGVLTGRKVDGGRITCTIPRRRILIVIGSLVAEGRSTGGKEGKWREEYLHNDWKEETDRKPVAGGRSTDRKQSS